MKRALTCAALAGALLACSKPAEQPPKANAQDASVKVSFVDVTQQAGIRFTHNNGSAGKKYLPETLGSGVVFFDYDGDGWDDLFFVNSKSWKAGGEPSYPALYRNRQDGTFEDVTAKAGLARETFGMGAAAADYDNDGDADLYVSAYGADLLYRNEGDGTFTEVAARSGVSNLDFGTSVAWLDYDKDGLLDVFVANYVQWSPETDLWCSLDGQSKSYCTPESYDGVSSRLFRNVDGKRFEDTTRAAGLYDETEKSLGVAVFDFDSDGWVDLFLANDTQPNKLYRNNGDGTFTEQGMTAGVAFAEDGRARGAMGVDAADYDGSGKPHLVVGNFSNEMITLYHNEGQGLFLDEAPRSEIGQSSLLSLTFGTFFFDYDLDGRLDVFAANGHLDPEVENVQPNVTYRQPALLYRNLGGGKFRRMTAEDVGADLFQPLVGRGAAYADFDHDGDLDIVVTSNGGPARLFRNDGGNANHALAIRLEGVKSDRDGIGALVRVRTDAGEQWTLARTGSSYCSQSARTLTFGLGPSTKADQVEVLWPSGATSTLTDVESGELTIVRE
ncbi:MAG: CRTAC1 family protein [Bryobacterales bacterium]